jgi:hypothetical protein
VAAKLVKHAKDYPFGSLYHYLHTIGGILDLRGRFLRVLYEQYRFL